MKYILTTTKNKITIDDADYQKFKSVSGSGNFVQLKQGIVNPSYVVTIEPIVDEKVEKKVTGYIDEDTKKFVVTDEKIMDSTVEDQFQKPPELMKLYGEKRL